MIQKKRSMISGSRRYLLLCAANSLDSCVRKVAVCWYHLRKLWYYLIASISLTSIIRDIMYNTRDCWKLKEWPHIWTRRGPSMTSLGNWRSGWTKYGSLRRKLLWTWLVVRELVFYRIVLEFHRVIFRSNIVIRNASSERYKTECSKETRSISRGTPWRNIVGFNWRVLLN